jgi:hypothetical protein
VDLEELNLSGAPITDGGLESLAALPSLRRLILAPQPVTPAAVLRLQTALPGLLVTR